MIAGNRTSSWTGDFWGGLASMLVALPSAIAFGVTIYAPLGGGHAALGALAGILGTTALGLIAATFGGTDRLITAPCAPAAALLAAFTIDMMQRGTAPESVLLMLMLIGLTAGAIQIGFGLSGVGRLIKYIPYPVVSGYLSAVGLTIIGSQLPRVLGAAKEVGLVQALLHPEGWRWQSLAVGATVMVTMLGVPRLTRAVPPAIIALLAGILVYFSLGLIDPRLWQVENNPLIVGPISLAGGSLLAAVGSNLSALRAWDPALPTSFSRRWSRRSARAPM
jgi:SulP family sulfate permease